LIASGRPALPAAAAVAVLALLLASGGADAQRRPGGRGYPEPTAVIRAEIAFNQRAQADGQWTAFRKTADKDAIMFVPQVVNAQRWLGKQADPAQSVVWWPSRIFMSCDGSYAAATGGWQRPDGSVGYFTTLWRRQKKGDYRWVFDHGDTLPAFRAQREDDLEAKVAECPRDPRADAIPDGGKPGKVAIVRIADSPPANGQGQSSDGSLRWQWTTRPDGSRTVSVSMRYEGEMRAVITDDVKADGVKAAGTQAAVR